jgi:hypothetical protein
MRHYKLLIASLLALISVASGSLTSTLYDGDMRVYYPVHHPGSEYDLIWELSWHRDSGRWESRDLADSDLSPDLLPYGGLTSTLYDGDMRVYYPFFYPNSEGGYDIFELSWHRDSEQWKSRDVLADAGGLPANSLNTPTSTLYDGDMRVYYQAKNNHIWELSWHRDSGQWESRDVLADAGGHEAA